MGRLSLFTDVWVFSSSLRQARRCVWQAMAVHSRMFLAHRRDIGSSILPSWNLHVVRAIRVFYFPFLISRWLRKVPLSRNFCCLMNHYRSLNCIPNTKFFIQCDESFARLGTYQVVVNEYFGHITDVFAGSCSYNSNSDWYHRLHDTTREGQKLQLRILFSRGSNRPGSRKSDS